MADLYQMLPGLRHEFRSVDFDVNRVLGNIANLAIRQLDLVFAVLDSAQYNQFVAGLRRLSCPSGWRP